jgi:mono/diheme cytochrome c family protein
MKKFSLWSLVICLAVIGLLAMRDGAFVAPTIPAFVTAAVSADSLLSLGDISDDDLAAGQRIFESQCTVCHSAPLVFKSRVLAGDVDSLIAGMLDKDHVTLPEHETSVLSAYLKTRLPRK